MSNAYTRGLAEYIAASRYDALPRPIVEHVKLLVLDALGVGLLGSTLPWSERLRATVAATEAAGTSVVWGTALRFSAPSAAMINGTAVHGFELDDVGAGGHNGSVTVPSALALANQRGGISGKELIAAVVTGIETASRVQRCVGNIPHVELGFHGPGLMGTFASVASAACVLKLSADEVVHALGHAGQQAASLMFTHHGGMGKRLLAGQAARAGTFAALLAANGFTNADNVFEAEYGGFPAAHTGNRRPPAYKLAELTKDLGAQYNTPGALIKLWACRVPNHGTLEGIKELRRQHPIPPDQVKQVRIKLGKGYLQNVGWPYTPTTITSAQLNLYYVAAIMLLEDAVFVEQFTEEKIRAPKVLEMIGRIEITRDPALDSAGSAEGNPVEIELKDGTVLKTWGRQRGGADRPIPPADVVEKFRRVTGGRISRAVQERIVALCDRLETLDDATALIAAIPA
ncbi:MAG: MmgE/PrpD family protein [Candidatus Lambdaproteobacteria bacterium]|nr:MmgE/PrpD family protein [Candidatus Lambdaproteobacteria bacterium]